MAIATEIGRLQGAKQDLISRLKAKGVTVPKDATLEEITPLVDNISGSGGSGGGSVETCTVTLNNPNEAEYAIEGCVIGSDGNIRRYANNGSYSSLSVTVVKHSLFAIIAGKWHLNLRQMMDSVDDVYPALWLQDGLMTLSPHGDITIDIIPY